MLLTKYIVNSIDPSVVTWCVERSVQETCHAICHLLEVTVCGCTVVEITGFHEIWYC